MEILETIGRRSGSRTLTLLCSGIQRAKGSRSRAGDLHGDASTSNAAPEEPIPVPAFLSVRVVLQAIKVAPIACNTHEALARSAVARGALAKRVERVGRASTVPPAASVSIVVARALCSGKREEGSEDNGELHDGKQRSAE